MSFTKYREGGHWPWEKEKKANAINFLPTILSQAIQTISRKITQCHCAGCFPICPQTHSSPFPCSARYCRALTPLNSRPRLFNNWFLIRMDHWGNNDQRQEGEKWENQDIYPPFSLWVVGHLRQGSISIMAPSLSRPPKLWFHPFVPRAVGAISVSSVGKLYVASLTSDCLLRSPIMFKTSLPKLNFLC